MNSEALQEALYDALNVSLITAQLGAGGLKNEWATQVIDGAVVTDFPFITMTFPAIGQLSDKSEVGMDAFVQIDIWDRNNGLRIKALADDVFATLNRQTLDVAGHILTEGDETVFSRDQDGVTRRAMMRFRVMALA